VLGGSPVLIGVLPNLVEAECIENFDAAVQSSRDQSDITHVFDASNFFFFLVRGY